ncbi:unnamed protein product, partial [Didymodactylos carnosus]
MFGECMTVSSRENIIKEIQTIVDAIQTVRANQQEYLKFEEKLKKFNDILQNTENQLEAKPSNDLYNLLAQLYRTGQSAENFLSQYNGQDCLNRNDLYGRIKTDLELLNKKLTQDMIDTLLCGQNTSIINKLEVHTDVKNKDRQKIKKKSYTMNDFELLFDPIREHYRTTFSRIERLVNRRKNY